MSSIEDLARRFDTDRRRLGSVAFHVLGSVADAEDAVQSAWLKASGADHDPRSHGCIGYRSITKPLR
jgi:DNA-directed RNA polymerase specialized sigma24 family protein